MIKVILLDVDGTLISFETHKVPPSSIKALKEAHDKGIKIVIATGRAAGDLHEISAVPYNGIIALNGADCTLRDGTVIRRHPIPKEDFKKSIEIAKELDFAVAIELDEGVFVNQMTPTVEQLAKIVEHPIPPVVDIEELFEKENVASFVFILIMRRSKSDASPAEPFRLTLVSVICRHQCNRNQQGFRPFGICGILWS